MNLRLIPVIPTLLVIAAAGYMVHLGLWQLDRLRQKEAMIASFTAAQDLPLLDAPEGVAAGTQRFRHVRLTCSAFTDAQMSGGRNSKGESGWVLWARCITPSGRKGDMVRAGWSTQAVPAALGAASVTGQFIGGDMGVDGKSVSHVVADPPLAGLQANAKPNPRDLPNNHLSYAVQWFAFALTALVIYALALRKRLKAA